MSNQHEQIDLTTLKEVERLLTTTEFASIEDIAKRGAFASATSARSAGPASTDGAGDGLAPLPKRR